MKNSVLLLAMVLIAVAAEAAHAATVQFPLYQTTSADNGSAVLDASDNRALAYVAGGYFYGSDCGGNAQRTRITGRRHAPAPGVILGGVGGKSIAGALN